MNVGNTISLGVEGVEVDTLTKEGATVYLYSYLVQLMSSSQTIFCSSFCHVTLQLKGLGGSVQTWFDVTKVRTGHS